MHQRHKVNRTRRKAIMAVLGLMLGGGGLVAVNAITNASSANQAGAGVVRPGVAERLPGVPDGARGEVHRNPALMRLQEETPRPRCHRRRTGPRALARHRALWRPTGQRRWGVSSSPSNVRARGALRDCRVSPGLAGRHMEPVGGRPLLGECAGGACDPEASRSPLSVWVGMPAGSRAGGEVVGLLRCGRTNLLPLTRKCATGLFVATME